MRATLVLRRFFASRQQRIVKSRLDCGSPLSVTLIATVNSHATVLRGFRTGSRKFHFWQRHRTNPAVPPLRVVYQQPKLLPQGLHKSSLRAVVPPRVVPPPPAQRRFHHSMLERNWWQTTPFAATMSSSTAALDAWVPPKPRNDPNSHWQKWWWLTAAAVLPTSSALLWSGCRQHRRRQLQGHGSRRETDSRSGHHHEVAARGASWWGTRAWFHRVSQLARSSESTVWASSMSWWIQRLVLGPLDSRSIVLRNITTSKQVISSPPVWPSCQETLDYQQPTSWVWDSLSNSRASREEPSLVLATSPSSDDFLPLVDIDTHDPVINFGAFAAPDVKEGVLPLWTSFSSTASLPSLLSSPSHSLTDDDDVQWTDRHLGAARFEPMQVSPVLSARTNEDDAGLVASLDLFAQPSATTLETLPPPDLLSAVSHEVSDDSSSTSSKSQALSLQPVPSSGTLHRRSSSLTATLGLKKKKTRRKYEPELVQLYDFDSDKDILMGRGGHAQHYPGNQRFLREKEELQDLYLACTKDEKTAVAQTLVDRVHAWGGRFLQKADGGRYAQVHNHTARLKASQTLREVRRDAAVG
jgi:hypothetical protein